MCLVGLGWDPPALAHGRDVSVILREFSSLFPLGFSALVVLVEVLALAFLIRGDITPVRFLLVSWSCPVRSRAVEGILRARFRLVLSDLRGFGCFWLEWDQSLSGFGRAVAGLWITVAGFLICVPPCDQFQGWVANGAVDRFSER